MVDHKISNSERFAPRPSFPDLILVLCGLSACRSPAVGNFKDTDSVAIASRRLPTGATLDPTGRLLDLGSFPLALVPVPEGDGLVVLLNGYRQQGLQVIRPSAGGVVQTLGQPAAFIGLRFDAAGRHLYASGGNQDVIYRYDWERGAATLKDSLRLTSTAPGSRYPAGLALSPDGRQLYVAENLADSLAVLDLTSGEVIQRLPAGRYPYAVAVSPEGTVYVSAWGGFEIRSFRSTGASLAVSGAIRVGRHPSAMLLNRSGSRLFVTSASTDRVSVVDTRARRVIAELVDTVPGASGEGSTPNALALSPDGRRLFVAEADNNAVALFDLSAATSGEPGAGGRNHLAGRIPVGWYPSALVLRNDTLLVANAKGRGTGPNGKDGPGPGRPPGDHSGYTLSQLSGTLSLIPLAGLDSTALNNLSARVARANGWDQKPSRAAYPPFEHVIYVIKENRTYDQIFGDLPQADGDTSLVYFPRAITPNHHALAERFGVFDRFFVDAEVSADGHSWSMAAYATDYTEKTLPSNYSGRGRSYDYEGENRGVRPEPGEDAAEPAGGYLWDLARRRGITFRNFGEFVMPSNVGSDAPEVSGYRGLKPFLESHTDSAYPGFDLDIPDQRRMTLWLKVLEQWERDGQMPALQIVRLPNDHTEGAKTGALTPRSYLADNDLALGRMIEGLSRSRFWKNTVVFVVEDDAQNGPDHVDSHRAPFLLISAYSRPRVLHRFTNTTDVIATIEELLTLQHLSQFDAFGRPLRGIFSDTADLTPYTAQEPEGSLGERNLAGGPGAKESSKLDFRFEDLADEDTFNRALWLAIKGTTRPYPGRRSLTAP